MNDDEINIEIEEIEISRSIVVSERRTIYDSKQNDFYDAFVVAMHCSSGKVYKFAVPVELYNSYFKLL